MNLLLALVLLAEPHAGGDAEQPVAPQTDLEEATPAAEPAETYGPFYEDVAPSDTAYPTDPRRGSKYPWFSVGRGSFCFVEDSRCRVSLLASGDVAAGLAIRSGKQGPDLPYAHFSFRGGLALRPIALLRRKWHPWGIGLVGGWSRGTGSVTLAGDEQDDPRETPSTDAWRVALLNQIWLSQKPHAFHVDFTLGVVRSNVLSTTGEFKLFGTHAEVAFGWGGWGSLFVGADFLDQDTRAVIGLRMHGIIAAPITGLVLGGMAAGGAL